MIKRVATMFGLDPDYVYEKNVDWVFMWLYTAKMENEFNQRYQSISEQLRKK